MDKIGKLSKENVTILDSMADKGAEIEVDVPIGSVEAKKKRPPSVTRKNLKRINKKEGMDFTLLYYVLYLWG